MIKKIIILLILITTIYPAQASILESNNFVTSATVPHYLSGTCAYPNCIGIAGSTHIDGQIITTPDSWEEIESILLYLRRESNNHTGLSTMTVRIYKSTTSDPATSSLYLWQTTTLSPSSITGQGYTINLNYPIVMWDGTTKVTNYIFITMQENYVPDIDNTQEVTYGRTVESTDKYTGGKLYQWTGSAWEIRESHYSPAKYEDFTFIVYGQWKSPPIPTPTGTPSTTPGDTPVAPGGTPPPFDTGTGSYPSVYGNGSEPLCGGNQCNGTAPSNLPGTSTNTLPGGIIDGAGYDFNNDGRITEDEAIAFGYDTSIMFYFLTWLMIIATRRSKFRPRKRR